MNKMEDGPIEQSRPRLLEIEESQIATHSVDILKSFGENLESEMAKKLVNLIEKAKKELDLALLKYKDTLAILAYQENRGEISEPNTIKWVKIEAKKSLEDSIEKIQKQIKIQLADFLKK